MPKLNPSKTCPECGSDNTQVWRDNMPPGKDTWFCHNCSAAWEVDR